jgi:hypothetical protein
MKLTARAIEVKPVDMMISIRKICAATSSTAARGRSSLAVLG